MRSLLAAALLIASLTACGRETPAPAASTAPASSASAAPTATPTAANATAPASASDVSAVASTQQEVADTGTAFDNSEAALERIAALPPEGQLPSGKWVAGMNYQVVTPAQPTDSPAGKVEVIEFFWYGCPHCYALDPYIASWLKNKPNYIDFKRVPAVFNPNWQAHARLYYTLQALNKVDALHAKVFDAIQQQQLPLLVPGDDKATLQAQTKWAVSNGVNEQDFVNAYNSFGVQTALQRSDELERRYRITGVPTVVINGKYLTDVGMAGDQAKLIELINDLAASEKGR